MCRLRRRRGIGRGDIGAMELSQASGRPPLSLSFQPLSSLLAPAKMKGDRNWTTLAVRYCVLVAATASDT